ncbi:hypothetical protein LA080_005908 [Diaporthe eres]|nr:hypothetical protein LA080_005908 [Diaporthe eres]
MIRTTSPSPLVMARDQLEDGCPRECGLLDFIGPFRGSGRLNYVYKACAKTGPAITTYYRSVVRITALKRML